MKNFPSKITSFRNSILFDMMIVLDNIPMMGIGVKSLHSKSKLDFDDYIKALTYLYSPARSVFETRAGLLCKWR